MKITINRQEYEVATGASVVDAIAAIEAKPPFAVAVNTEFVPRTQYARTPLHDGDRVEIISPVTGG